MEKGKATQALSGRWRPRPGHIREVDVSGRHRISAQCTPWADMRPLVRAVVDARPDRVLWGSDWPHPNQYDEMQNDGDLLDAFAQWVPEEHLRQQILVENPAALYEFSQLG